jgi:hypothetical protein
MKLFKRVTGGAFPGSDKYEFVITTIQYLREKHGKGLEAYLMPFWTAWTKGKTKDNRPYSKTNPAWLEWAVQGETPRVNGHEPTSSWSPIPGVDQTRKMLEEKDQIRARASKPVSIKDVAGKMAHK